MFFVRLTVVSTLVASALGDPNDWVSVDYVVAKYQGGRSVRTVTSDAETTIVHNAEKTASDGPWSVVNAKSILPPSGNPHDYLSWAPYHWPNCNWCPTSRTHLAHTVDGSNNETDATGTGLQTSPDTFSSTYAQDDPYQYFMSLPDKSKIYLRRQQAELPDHPSTTSPDIPGFLSSATPQPSSVVPPVALPTNPLATQTTDGRTHGPAQAAAKTTQSTCTPSPTKSLAPSATWTTCPYVVRDGNVNPDVRTLRGPDAVNSMTQSAIYNAVAYALRKQASYSKNVASFVDTFFIQDATKVNPNLNFGQIVRGPGEEGRKGTFTGVLDFRGMVKLVNAIAILKRSSSPDWTAAREKAMKSWVTSYNGWLQNSDIGKETASRANNHVTFYVSQLAALKMSLGDTAGASATLQGFFKGAFLDQVAASGEQPFEAIRTRPYHYRAFNIEGLVTNAKLGDQLGLNLWTAKSKYGATIQTTVNYLMAQDPKTEDVTQALPLVAAVAAAYGDPNNKYAAFLKKHDSSYQSKPYWFYNQAGALSNAPSSRSKSKRSVIWSREDSPAPASPDADPGSVVPFACPSVFEGAIEVEIDDGIFVNCDELRPLYLDSKMPDTTTLDT